MTCLELMPVANVGFTVDWEYLQIGYFGVDERFGRQCDLQCLIDPAHSRGLAVVVDAVYAHASADFPYADAYRRLNNHENPVVGPFADNAFGVSADFGRGFTRDFVIYTTMFAGVVYVLHAFKKKSTSGIATAKQHIDVIKRPLQDAAEIHAEEEALAASNGQNDAERVRFS